MKQTSDNPNAVSREMREVISRELRAIEAAENVRILYACESGSRAWGFASQDSDYDVRFIYAHRPEWYLSIRKRREVTERPIDGDLDLAGWDIRKTLLLFHKCNPALLEWLDSPIIYREDGPPAAELRRLREDFFSPIAAMHHYLHMAEGNWRAYLQKPMVNRKKYLYTIRPLLACEWIRQARGPVPTPFQTLLDELLPTGREREAMDMLLTQKVSGMEFDKTPPEPILQEWIRSRLHLFAEIAGTLPPAKDKNLDVLDSLFRRIIALA